jgi:histidyl-tRNA synthetase
MHDVLPEDQPYRRHVTSAAAESARLAGYERIDTPTLEETALFVRGVGEGTDLIDKEMYSFETRGGDAVTMRAEGTAPVMRAFLEHGFESRAVPVRLYYLVPIFRHDRPGAGRYREHMQFGAECVGVADAAADAEIIVLAWDFYRRCGLTRLDLQLSSIGDDVCRPAYIQALRAYYEGVIDQACDACHERLEKNPLRLLDCKEPSCQPLIERAPKPVEHLCAPCQQHFQALQSYLRSMDIPFALNSRLVRGLGYYTRTVFEVFPAAHGSQSAIGGGGRYDRLLEELGGKPTPAVGFGIGLERVILALKAEGLQLRPAHPEVYVAALGDAARAAVPILLKQLRQAEIASLGALEERSLKAQLRFAEQLGVTYAVILGDYELAQGTVQLKNLKLRQQTSVPKDDLVEVILRER